MAGPTRSVPVPGSFTPTAATLTANSDESVRAAISKFPQFFLPILFAAGGRLSSQRRAGPPSSLFPPRHFVHGGEGPRERSGGLEGTFLPLPSWPGLSESFLACTSRLRTSKLLCPVRGRFKAGRQPPCSFAPPGIFLDRSGEWNKMTCCGRTYGGQDHGNPNLLCESEPSPIR